MEEKKKTNPVIIILLILLIGLSTYVVYDKFFKVNSTKESEKEKANTEEKTTYKEYLVGEQITFANEKWHVISNSDKSQDYVTVIKSTSISELNQQPYYECPQADDNGINCSNKMSNDYQKSKPKEYFDKTYINMLGDKNLKEVNGYKIRLITLNELISLGCKKYSDIYYTCDNAPTWIPDTWTMTYTTTTPTDDASESSVWYFGQELDSTQKTISQIGVGSTMSVSPIINLLKSSIY